MPAKDIDVFLSGGSANTNPNVSLGGVISSTKLMGQVPVYEAASIAGITLIDSVSLTRANLEFLFATKLLSIRLVGDGSPVVQIDVSVDGDYVLPTPDGNAELTVSIVNASLPAVDSLVVVDATNIMHNLFDAVSSAESQVGNINYRHLYIKNLSGSERALKVIVNKQFNGLDYIEIGFFSVTSGNIDELLSNELSAPANVEFSAPSNSDNAILLTVLPAGLIGMYLKRTVLALTDISTPEDTAALEIIEFS